MTTLLLAEHDNATLNEPPQGADRRQGAGRAGACPRRRPNAKAVADAAAKLDGVEKVLLADDAAYEHRLAEPLAALIVSLAGPYDASSRRAPRPART
jgi:electron transfer flavoprotein alpha subunit